jgi:hypothetical protein
MRLPKSAAGLLGFLVEAAIGFFTGLLAALDTVVVEDLLAICGAFVLH